MFSFLEWPQLGAYISTVFFLNLLPGADVLFICGQSLQGGRQHGIFAALGISTGFMIYIIATIFGIAELFKVAPHLFHILRLLGVAYLFYLSYQAFRAQCKNQCKNKSSGPNHQGASPFGDVVLAKNMVTTYGQGVMTSILNPKVVIFFFTFLPQFTNEKSLVPMAVQLLTLGIWFVISGTIVNVGYAILVSKIRGRVLQNTFMQTKLHLVTGVLFGLLAIGLLWTMVREL